MSVTNISRFPAFNESATPDAASFLKVYIQERRESLVIVNPKTSVDQESAMNGGVDMVAHRPLNNFGIGALAYLCSPFKR